MTQLIKTYKIGERPKISDGKEVYKEIKKLFDPGKELLIVIILDSQNGIIAREIVHIGGLNQAMVEPRAVFRKAISLNANSIIFAHNHPSGFLKPSNSDIVIRDKLKEAGEILGIEILDNIIFNNKTYESYNVATKEE